MQPPTTSSHIRVGASHDCVQYPSQDPSLRATVARISGRIVEPCSAELSVESSLSIERSGRCPLEPDEQDYISELANLAQLALVELSQVKGSALERSLGYLREQADEQGVTSAGFNSSI